MSMRNSKILIKQLEELSGGKYVSRTDLSDYMNDFKEIPLKRMEKIRKKYNRLFISREQGKIYEVEGNRLDAKQIEAVVACEDAALFLAPAGSGKSASLLAKVNYLIDDLNILPEKILVIAFTNKVVVELQERVKDLKVEIRTFHSLGNKIIQGNQEKRELISEGEIIKVFDVIVNKLTKERVNYAEKYRNYLKDEKQSEINFGECREEEDGQKLVKMFISVMSLQKGEGADLKEFKKRLEVIECDKSRKRAMDFFELYEPVVRMYQEYLKKYRKYDFSDMLIEARELIETMPEGSMSYRYVLVDEAQDMSTSKYLLLKAVLDKCERVKLFAVGDDWQSIYRFAGSNLQVLDDFEKIFQRETYRGVIGLTYRFGEPTAKVSNKFIQKNPYQSKKRVISHVKRKTPIEIKLNYCGKKMTQPRDYKVVDEEIQKLFAEYGENIFKKKVQIIARYNRDLYRLVTVAGRFKNAKIEGGEDGQIELKWWIAEVECWLKVGFCSMHKAKGITRDIVFVINMNQGEMGMPATRGNKAVEEVLLAKLDAFPFAEERRLFYVAMTRAKEKTIMIAEAEKISDFIFEINPRLKGTGEKVCPKCRRGILLKKRRKRDGQVFVVCSNNKCKYIK